MAGENTEIEQPKAVSVGKVQRAEMNPVSQAITPEIEGNKNVAPPQNTIDENKDVSQANAAATTTPEPEVELTEEQQKAFFKKLGIEYKGSEDFEALKNKLQPKPAEPTDEEKKAAITAEEMKMAELFVKNGGTLEQFNTIKKIANDDPAEFSKKSAIIELVEAGFTEEEAKNIAKEMYYQIELDNIEQDEEESDDDFERRKKLLEKKVGFGSKKLNSQASTIQQQAAEVLKGLQDAIKSDELRRNEEVTFLSNVDKTLQSIPRKQTYELGKVNDMDLPPIQHEVSEDSIKAAEEILKDPAKRNNFFYNKDNSLNLTNIAPLLVNHFEQTRSIKGALLEGQSRQVDEFRKVFPAQSAHDLGVNGSQPKNNQKGAAVSRGKKQVVSPSYN